MDVVTDAVPSAPRAREETIQTDQTDQTNQTDEAQSKPRGRGIPEPKKRPRTATKNNKDGSYVQNVTLTNCVNVQIGTTINNLININPAVSKSPKQVPKQRRPSENIQKFFASQDEATDQHLNIVSNCLSPKGVKLLGRLLHVADPDRKRIEADYKQKGTAEVCFHVLKFWKDQNSIGSSKAQLNILCDKLWQEEVYFEGGDTALKELEAYETG